MVNCDKCAAITAKNSHNSYSFGTLKIPGVLHFAHPKNGLTIAPHWWHAVLAAAIFLSKQAAHSTLSTLILASHVLHFLFGFIYHLDDLCAQKITTHRNSCQYCVSVIPFESVLIVRLYSPVVYSRQRAGIMNPITFPALSYMRGWSNLYLHT